jgi:hypothetical protein
MPSHCTLSTRHTMSSWPPATGLTTKIVARKDAILQFYYATTIHAPAQLVFDTVLRAENYPQWNTWVPAARIDPASGDPAYMRIGSTMTFDVVMDANKPDSLTHTYLRVTDICTPSAQTNYLGPGLLQDPTFTADLTKVYRVSWTGHGGMNSLGLMKVERFHEVIVLGDDECEVRTWEVMGGVLARVVKMLYQATLQEKVGVWCADLKTESERLHAAGPTS